MLIINFQSSSFHFFFLKIANIKIQKNLNKIDKIKYYKLREFYGIRVSFVGCKNFEKLHISIILQKKNFFLKLLIMSLILGFV